MKGIKLTVIYTVLIVVCMCIEDPTTTPSPAQFEVTDLRIIPENPKVGDTLIVLIDVWNKGESSGSHAVLVIIGGTSKRKTVELEGKSSKTVEFQDTVNIEGYMEIEAGSFSKMIYVEPLETPTPTLPPTTTPKPTETPEESKTWHFVARFSGKGDGETSRFYIKAHQWKVEYNFSSTSIYCQFQVLWGDPIISCVGHCEGKVDFCNGKREWGYMFTIQTEDWGSWELTVYEYY